MNKILAIAKKELKPTEFDDIVAMCALYRPGPLTAGLTDSFVIAH